MPTLEEVAEDISNTDFTGHIRATGRSLWLAYADTMIFIHGESRYLWIGSRSITVGLDGSHIATEYDLLHLSSLSHFDLSGVGSYTHAQIDAHIDAPDPHIGHVSGGGAGMYLSVPMAPVDSTIGLVPELVLGYDMVQLPEQDAVANLGSSSIMLLETGFWLGGFTFAIEIDQITANDSADIAAALYNITDAVQLQTIAYATAPRYGETLSMNVVFNAAVDAGMINKEFGIVVWVHSAPGNQINVNLMDSLEFWCTRVSHKSVNPVSR